MGNLNVFAQNIYLLLGLLVFAGVTFVVIILSWSGIRVWFWQRSVDRATQAWRATRYRPDGTRFPPSGPGICFHCHTAFKKVYYLSTGDRVCPSCYLDVDESVEASPANESPVK
jgi:hypothetical protein